MRLNDILFKLGKIEDRFKLRGQKAWGMFVGMIVAIVAVTITKFAGCLD